MLPQSSCLDFAVDVAGAPVSGGLRSKVFDLVHVHSPKALQEFALQVPDGASDYEAGHVKYFLNLQLGVETRDHGRARSSSAPCREELHRTTAPRTQGNTGMSSA